MNFVILWKNYFLSLLCCLALVLSNSTQAKTQNPPKKKAPSKQASSVPLPRLGAQTPNKANYLNPYSFNQSNNTGEPLPTPNIIENILKTPTPEVVKSNSNIRRYSIKHGCGAVTPSIADFLKNLYIQDIDLLNSFNRQAPDFFKSINAICLPFAYSVDNMNNKIQAFSILSNEKRDVSTTLITINRSPTTESYILNSQVLGKGFENYLEVTVDLNDLLVYKANQATTLIPPELIWELASLVKTLYPKIRSNENHLARVVYDAGNKDRWAQVISLEILDTTQKNMIADAFWVKRDDLPGGFFTSNGEELEQNFWINPLNYTRISRGVGGFASTSRRPAVVKKGNKNVVVLQSYTSYSGHQGIDFAAPIGTPIYAVANGKIVQYSPYAGYGNLVIVEHPGNYKTYYAHLSAYNPELSVGSEVRRGLEIGYVGSTGHSTGPHLHFELRKNNVYLNPLSNGLELDLWSLNPSDQFELTNNIVLFSTLIN